MKCIFATLLLMVSLGYAQDSDLLEADGTNWQRASDSYKTGFVAGYISGMGDAHTGLVIFCTFDLNLKANSPELQKCSKRAYSYNFTEITVRQFVAGMDAFYKDFRNTQFPMHGAMRIVRDQINGRPADEIEKELVAWRQCHADSSKCDYSKPEKQTTPEPTK